MGRAAIQLHQMHCKRLNNNIGRNPFALIQLRHGTIWHTVEIIQLCAKILPKISKG